MKISRLFKDKTNLANKINKRNMKRIAEYTKVSDDLLPTSRPVVYQHIDKIARIAKRKCVNIEFTNGKGALKQTPIMNVYKKYIQMTKNEDGRSEIVQCTKTLIGKIFMRDDIKSSTIHKAINSALESNKAKKIFQAQKEHEKICQKIFAPLDFFKIF